MFSLLNICFCQNIYFYGYFLQCVVGFQRITFEQSFPCSKYEIISALSKDHIYKMLKSYGRITVPRIKHLLNGRPILHKEHYYVEFDDLFPIIQVIVWELSSGHNFPNQHPQMTIHRSSMKMCDQLKIQLPSILNTAYQET